jgi:RNA polymerase sigma-70 factor (ECF subfamily)
MTDGRTDEELMMAYAAGDAEAFEQLYARHRGPLFRFVLRSVGNPARAEEVFQDTWVRLIGARVGYRPSARFRTWLYQIAHNLVIDQARRERRAPQVGDPAAVLEGLVSEQPGPEATTGRDERNARLARAVDELPPDQRTAFLLWAESDFGPDDIAASTGVGRETAKSRLRYALAKLRQVLGE